MTQKNGKCPIAKEDYIYLLILDDENELKEHRGSHIIEDRKSQLPLFECSIDLIFICKICKEQFLSTDLFKKHLLAKHNIEKYDEFCEPVVIKKDKSMQISQRHRINNTVGVPTEKKFTKIHRSLCIYCDEFFLEGFHSNSKNLKCCFCEQIYPCEGSLNHHIENIHSGDKLSHELSAEYYHKTDNDYINDKPLHCNVCKRAYFTMKGLQKHISTHYNIYICDYCGIKYTLKDNLRRHILIKHMNFIRYSCKLCHKGFLFEQEYKVHQVVHTKIRSSQCHVCGKNFTTKKTLQIHSRLHTGEKPIVCVLCQDRFISASRLKQHMQIKHIGKIDCPKCGKGFTRKESVTKHLKLQRCEF